MHCMKFYVCALEKKSKNAFAVGGGVGGGAMNRLTVDLKQLAS